MRNLHERPDMDVSGARCGGRSGWNNGRSKKVLGSTTSNDQLVIFRRCENPSIRPRVQALENVSAYGSTVSLNDDEIDGGSSDSEGDEDLTYNLLDEHHSQMASRGYTSVCRKLNVRKCATRQSRERLYNADIDKSDECGL